MIMFAIEVADCFFGLLIINFNDRLIGVFATLFPVDQFRTLIRGGLGCNTETILKFTGSGHCSGTTKSLEKSNKVPKELIYISKRIIWKAYIFSAAGFFVHEAFMAW